jgi:sulfate/thiosulfate transport system substrate-binding protein
MIRAEVPKPGDKDVTMITMLVLKLMKPGAVGIVLCAMAVAPGCGRSSNDAPLRLLNVSYDPTRELYQEFNEAFARHWKQKTGQAVVIEMSHGGSGKQARAVIEGQQASVVTLALAYDIDAIAKQAKLLSPDWQRRLPNRSCPYTSTIVFLVRQGNPKNIHHWEDLVRGEVSIITPNPKTSGGARWNYLAAWGAVLLRELGDMKKIQDPNQAPAVAKAEEKAREFVAQMFRRVPVLDSGARGSTMTFVQRNMGDVLLAWENEAFLAIQQLGPDKLELVVPSVSILAEPTVAVVDQVADRLATRAAADEYLQYLYSREGQAIVAKNYYRPSNREAVPKEDLKRFQDLKLFTIDDVFGGWQKAQDTHFRDGGTFDEIYRPAK